MNAQTNIRLSLVAMTGLLLALALSSCGPSQEELRRRNAMAQSGIPDFGPPPITSRWYFKPLVFGGIALAGWGIHQLSSSGGSPGTSQPTRPASATPSLPPQQATGGEAKWHYRENGQEFGPFNQDALAQLATGRVITPETEIRREGGAWVKYRDIFGG